MFFKKSNPGIEQLKRHEGLRLKMYQCPAGANTIGWGHNCDVNPITEAAAEQILNDDLDLFIPAVIENFPVYNKLNQARKWVLINMAFNLGIAGLLEFELTIKAIEEGNYIKAANQMLMSKWATQVGDRARELARQMQSGKFPK